MAAAFLICLTSLLLYVSSAVCSDLLKAEQLLTIAVALPEESVNTSIVGTSQFSVGNESSPEITVLWAQVNHRGPFHVSLLMKEFVSRGVDLLFFPNDMFAVVKETVRAEFKVPSSLLLYRQSEEHPRNVPQTQPYDCYANNNDPLDTPGSDETCDPMTVRVDEVDILRMVIQRLEWTQLLILHEKSQEMAASVLSSKLSSEQSYPQLLLYSLEGVVDDDVTTASGNGRALNEVLEAVYNARQGELRVVLLCSAHCVGQVLNAASKFDSLNGRKTAMGMISRWLLVLPPNEEQALEAYDLDLDNVAAVVYCPNVVVFNDIQQEMEDILQTAYSYVMKRNQSATADAVSDSIRRTCQVPTGSFKSFVKTLLWKPEGRRLSEVGYVDSGGLLRMDNEQDVFPNIKFGLNNRTLVVATLPWPSFVERTGNGTYEGLCPDLLHQLKVSLNFRKIMYKSQVVASEKHAIFVNNTKYTSVWTEPEDQEWGAMTENNTWTGLIGLMERREADLIVAPITIQSERTAVADFTYPFYIDYTTVLLRLPDPADSKWKTLIRPFKTNVHVCIWISLLFVMLLIPALEYLNPYYTRHPKKSFLNVIDMFWFLLGALLAHGGCKLPASQTGRTMVSVFWIFSFLISASYCGNLIAFLTVTKAERPFNSLRGMVNQDLYTWGVTGGTFWVMVYQSSSLDVFKKIWEGIDRERGDDPDVLSLDPEVHLSKVKSGHYAFIGDKSAMSTWLKSECDLVTIDEEFLPLQYAVGLVKDSAYTSIFNEKLLRIDEMGLNEIWKRRWWSKTTVCGSGMTTVATPINLIDVQSAFYLAVIGLLLAFATLALENLSNRFHLVSRARSLFCARKGQNQEHTQHREPEVASPNVTVGFGCNLGFRGGQFGSAMVQTARNPLGSEFERPDAHTVY